MLRELGRFFRPWSRAPSGRSGVAGNGVGVVPAVPADVRVSFADDGVVFLHVGEGKLFRANASGRRIWQLLLENRPVNAIAEQLSGEYGVPSDRIERDAGAFVADLRCAGLLAMSNRE